jgi:signal-induced proliferation-associated 1 like protein 3
MPPVVPAPVPLVPVPVVPVPAPPVVPVLLSVPVPVFKPLPVAPEFVLLGFVLLRTPALPPVALGLVLLSVPGVFIPLPVPVVLPVPRVPLFFCLLSVQSVDVTFPLQFTPGVVVMVPVVLLCANATPGTHKLASDKASMVSLI